MIRLIPLILLTISYWQCFSQCDPVLSFSRSWRNINFTNNDPLCWTVPNGNAGLDGNGISGLGSPILRTGELVNTAGTFTIQARSIDNRPSGFRVYTRDLNLVTRQTQYINVSPGNFQSFTLNFTVGGRGYIDIVQETTNAPYVAMGNVSYSSSCPNRPEILARTQDITIYLDENGTAQITAEDVNNNSMDICGNTASVSIDQSQFDCSHIGSNDVTLTASVGDESAQSTAVVTILPYFGAWQTGDAPVVLELDASGNTSLTVSDLLTNPCPGYTYSLDRSVFDCTDAGDTISLQMTATDSNGGVYHSALDVQVIDAIAPTITNLPATYTLALISNASTILTLDDLSPSTGDNCASGITRTLSKSVFSCADMNQDIEVTLTVTDQAGNSSMDTVLVSVTGDITSQTVSTNASASICPDGSQSYTITTGGSQVGYEYLLVDTLTGSTVDGPVPGTGNAIDFTTPNITFTSTYQVIAQTPQTSGSALNYDGDNDHADATAPWNFNHAEGYTLEFLFNGTSKPLNFQNSLFSLGDQYISDLEVYWQAGEEMLVVAHGRGGGTPVQYNRYPSPPNNVTVHIAIVFDPNNGLNVHYDGVAQTRVPNDPHIGRYPTVKNTTSLWRIGAIENEAFGNTESAAGKLDEVRVWKVARSASEIAAFMDRCIDPIHPDLAHYYKLDENGGTLINDSKGALNLTLTHNTSGSNWVTELISCNPTCQAPMANTVTIGDKQAPSLSFLPRAVAYLNAQGAVSIQSSMYNNGTSDNCSSAEDLTFSSDGWSLDCAALGDTTVTVTVTDQAGNKSSQDVIFTISDTIPPVIHGILISTNHALDANGSLDISASWQATVSDNCSTNPIVTLDRTVFTCADVGSQIINFMATDASGNVATATRSIHILDVSAPTLVTNDITLSLDADGHATINEEDVIGSATDNCTDAADLMINIPTTSFDCRHVGVQSLSITATDAAGRVTTASSIITVTDQIAPTVTTRDITAELVNGAVTITPEDVNDGSFDNCTLTLSVDRTNFTTADLGANTVTLTGTDASGNTNAATATVTVSQPRTPQTITFSDIAATVIGDVVYGQTFTLSATASSGLPVSFTITGPGSIDGTQLILTGIGNVSVTASQEGSDTYSPAPPVTHSVSVVKSTLFIDAHDTTITYGDPIPTSYGFTYRGFVLDDTASDLTQEPIMEATASASSNAGNYSIRPVVFGQDEHYHFQYVNGSLTIDKAQQSISFAAIPDADLAMTTSVTLNATASSGLPVMYLVTSGNASLTGNTLNLEGSGLVTVQARQEGNVNYLGAGAETQTFTVLDSRKLSQTISFPAIADATYGDTPITLGATASSGLPISYSIMSGNAGTLTNNILTITGAGTLVIEAQQNGNEAYDAAHALTRSVLISPASITITPDDHEIIKGDDLPDFTYTLSGLVNGDTKESLDVLPQVGSPTADKDVTGTYPIVVTADALDDRYVFTNAQGTLLVIEPLTTLDRKKLSLYPIPAETLLHVEGLVEGSYRILDISGHYVKGGSIANGSIRVSDIAPGTYLLQVIHSGKSTLHTFIKH